eukprot:gene522-biopygen96
MTPLGVGVREKRPRTHPGRVRCFKFHRAGRVRSVSGSVSPISKARTGHGWGTPFNSFWCCYGTGIESNAKLGDTVYMESAGGGNATLCPSSRCDSRCARCGTLCVSPPHANVWSILRCAVAGYLGAVTVQRRSLSLYLALQQVRVAVRVLHRPLGTGRSDARAALHIPRREYDNVERHLLCIAQCIGCYNRGPRAWLGGGIAVDCH